MIDFILCSMIRCNTFNFVYVIVWEYCGTYNYPCSSFRITAVRKSGLKRRVLHGASKENPFLAMIPSRSLSWSRSDFYHYFVILRRIKLLLSSNNILLSLPNCYHDWLLCNPLFVKSQITLWCSLLHHSIVLIYKTTTSTNVQLNQMVSSKEFFNKYSLFLSNNNYDPLIQATDK